ncbi:twin-arginine translocation signal domain-containing protein [Sulfurimonas sp.]|uniref:twin-arginine translocation signal domain-containing protein n=1 Tax=Sulfurimonas sp. TaxID=2022749 RepID=UPI002AB2BB2B|nr:twin-arginine translocation signal domain-containing protein [Sulfurimonas sp.]
MQESRRNFLRKSAIVVGTAAVSATALAASQGSSTEVDSNGVVVGNSNKKEILYKKTQAWEEFYKQAL